MRLFLNPAGEVDCADAAPGDTAAGLLGAIDEYLAHNPLPCGPCPDSCCRKSWAMEADNVFARRMGREDVAPFVEEKLVPAWNHGLEFDQYVLKKDGPCPYVRADNACSIYAQRPLICRLYLCGPLSRRYNALRQAVGAAFLQALVLERAGGGCGGPGPGNPALFAGDYAVKLQDILAYALAQGWVDPEDIGGLI